MTLPEHPSPHDATFKAVFSRPENALALLRAALPARVIDALDPTSLEAEPSGVIDDDLRERFTDVLLRARLRDGRPARVFLLIEHQHQPEPWFPLRMLGYEVRIWEDWRRDHPAETQLPVILPVVLHQGPRPWGAARSLRELFDASPEVLDLLGERVPSLELPFHDLGERSPIEAADLSGPVLTRLALALLRAMADPDADPGEVLEALAPLVRSLVAEAGGPADLRRLVLYIGLARKGLDVPALGRRIRRVVNPEAAEVAMSTVQELLDQGEEQGLAKGLAKGLAEGEKKGEKKGEVKALRRVLQQLLTERFGQLPPEVTERVGGASTTQLRGWIGRVLGARRLADVFARSKATPRPVAGRRKRGDARA